MKFARPTQFVSKCVLTLLLTLAVCACQTSSPATSGFCDIAKPIPFSRLHDTPETIEAIKEHNAVWEKLCSK